MPQVAVLGAGMVTAVGNTAEASCAAVRCGIDNFAETRFMDRGGEWIIGSHVQLDQPWRGLPRLVRLVAPAIRECLGGYPGVLLDTVPLLLCVAEPGRPGRMSGLDDRLVEDIQSELGIRFHPRSGTVARGRVGGAIALAQARTLIHEERVPLCVVAGVDSLLVTETLRGYEAKKRLLTSENSNGFIPGEAGAAILVGPTGGSARPELLCLGIGSGREESTIDSESPLRADGLVQAFQSALAEAGCRVGDLDFRITDSNGEQYWFKEAALALDRCLRHRSELFDIWHPADCLGDVGAAIGPTAIGLAFEAHRKGWSFGRGPLCHFGGDDSDRFAVVLGANRSGST